MDNEKLQDSFASIRSGDKTAFAAVYNAMKTPVYTVILRIVGDRAAAEDVMQELFIKLYVSPPEPSVHNFRAWIFRMARNLAIDALRKKQEHTPLGELGETVKSDEPNVNGGIDIERALGRLPREEREIVTLHISAGLGFKDISGIVGLSLPAVYRRYKKALGSLRELLGGEL